MASLFSDTRTRDALDKITLGIVQSLEQRDGVIDVRIMDCKPADLSIISNWEQRHMCRLPDDLRNFYLTMDGLLIQWNVKFNGSVLQLGRIEINPVTSLVKIGTERCSALQDDPDIMDLEVEYDEMDDTGRIKPHFDNRHRLFELDSCEGNGKVCLVYKDLKAGFTICQPEIWFLDCALSWHHLADDFFTYFRMMMVHLGLPCWQYLFTDSGLGPETLEWFNLYAPERLHKSVAVKLNVDSASSSSAITTLCNKLDSTRVFKGRGDRRKIIKEENKAKVPQKQRNPNSRHSAKASLKSPTK